MSKAIKIPSHYETHSYTMGLKQNDITMAKLLNQSKNKGALEIGEHENKNVILDTDSDAPGKKSKRVANLVCFSTTQNVYSRKPLYQTREKLSSYLIKTQKNPLKNILNETKDLRQKSNRKDYNIIFPGKENSNSKSKLLSPQYALTTNESNRLFNSNEKANGNSVRIDTQSIKKSNNQIGDCTPKSNEPYQIDNEKIESVLSKLSVKKSNVVNCKKVFNAKSRNIQLPAYRIGFAKIENEKESDDNFEYDYLTSQIHNNSNIKVDQGGKVNFLLYWNFYEYVKKYQLTRVSLIQRMWRKKHARRSLIRSKVILIQSYWRRYWLRANLYYVINRYYKGRAFISHIKMFYRSNCKKYRKDFFSLLVDYYQLLKENSTRSRISRFDKEGDADSFHKETCEEVNKSDSIKENTNSNYTSYRQLTNRSKQETILDTKQKDYESIIKTVNDCNRVNMNSPFKNHQILNNHIEQIAFSLNSNRICKLYTIDKTEMSINSNTNIKEKKYLDLYNQLLKEYNDYKDANKIKAFTTIDFDEKRLQFDLLGMKANDSIKLQKLFTEQNEIAFTYKQIEKILMLEITKSNAIIIPKSVPSKFSLDKMNIKSFVNDLNIKSDKVSSFAALNSVNEFFVSIQSIQNKLKTLPSDYGINSYEVCINNKFNKQKEAQIDQEIIYEAQDTNNHSSSSVMGLKSKNKSKKKMMNEKQQNLQYTIVSKENEVLLLINRKQRIANYQCELLFNTHIKPQYLSKPFNGLISNTLNSFNLASKDISKSHYSIFKINNAIAININPLPYIKAFKDSSLALDSMSTNILSSVNHCNARTKLSVDSQSSNSQSEYQDKSRLFEMKFNKRFSLISLSYKSSLAKRNEMRRDQKQIINKSTNSQNKKKSQSAFVSLKRYNIKRSNKQFDIKPLSSINSLYNVSPSNKRHSLPQNENSTLSIALQNITNSKNNTTTTDKSSKHKETSIDSYSTLLNLPLQLNQLNQFNKRSSNYYRNNTYPLFKSFQTKTLVNKFNQYLSKSSSLNNTRNCNEESMLNMINKKWNDNMTHINTESFQINDSSWFNAEDHLYYLSKNTEHPLAESVFTRYLKPKQSMSSFSYSTPFEMHSFGFKLEPAYDQDEFAHNILLINSIRKNNLIRQESKVNQIEYVKYNKPKRSSIEKCLLPFQLKKRIIAYNKRDVYYTLVSNMKTLFKCNVRNDVIKRSALLCIKNDSRLLRKYYNKWRRVVLKLHVCAEIELNKRELVELNKPRLNESFSIMNNEITLSVQDKINKMAYQGKTSGLTEQSGVEDISNDGRCSGIDSKFLKQWKEMLSCHKVNSICYFNNDKNDNDQQHICMKTNTESIDNISNEIAKEFFTNSHYLSREDKDKRIISLVPKSNMVKSFISELQTQPQKAFSLIACRPFIIIRKHKRANGKTKKYYSTNFSNRLSFESNQFNTSREKAIIKRSSTKTLHSNEPFNKEIVNNWHSSQLYKTAKFQFIAQIRKGLTKLELCKAFIKWTNKYIINNNHQPYINAQTQIQNPEIERISTEPNVKDNRIELTDKFHDEISICNYSSRKCSIDNNNNSHANANNNDSHVSIPNLRIKKVRNQHKHNSTQINSSFPRQKKKMKTVTRYMSKEPKLTKSAVFNQRNKPIEDEELNLKSEQVCYNSTIQLINNNSINYNQLLLMFKSLIKQKFIKSAFEQLLFKTIGKRKMFKLINKTNQSLEILRLYLSKWKTITKQSDRIIILNRLISLYEAKNSKAYLGFNYYLCYWKRCINISNQSKSSYRIQSNADFLDENKGQRNLMETEGILSLRVLKKIVNKTMNNNNSYVIKRGFDQWRFLKNILNQQQPWIIKIKIKHVTIHRRKKLRSVLLTQMKIKSNSLQYYFNQWRNNSLPYHNNQHHYSLLRKLFRKWKDPTNASLIKQLKPSKAISLMVNIIKRNQIRYSFKLLSV